MRDITRELDAKSIEIPDLIDIFSAHLGSCSQSEEETTFYRTPEQSAVRMRHTNKGGLAAIELLEHGTQRDVDILRRLIAEFRSDLQETEVARRYVFTNIPLNHGLAFDGWFQFFPVPREAPQSDHMNARYPAIIEAAYSKPANGSIAMRRRIQALDEVELFLNVLYRGGVHTQRSSLNEWGFPVGSSDAPSVPFNVVYSWPAMPSGDGAFSEIQAYEDFAIAPYEQYYAHLGGMFVDGKPVPSIGSDFGRLASIYRALDRARQAQFLHAAYWFQYSGRVSSLSSSASYLALVQSIESLIEPSSEQKRCPMCDHLPGAVKAFHETVEQYAAGLDKKWRDRIYRARSRIVHSGRRLRADTSFDMHPAGLTEQSDQLGLSRLVRVILRNWLSESEMFLVPDNLSDTVANG